jgi:hypothetical protein
MSQPKQTDTCTTKDRQRSHVSEEVQAHVATHPRMLPFNYIQIVQFSTHPATSFSDEPMMFCGCVSELGYPEQMMGDQVFDQEGDVKRKKGGN